MSRSNSKQPLIGRDRLAILRANGTLPHTNSGMSGALLMGQKSRSSPAAHITMEVLPGPESNQRPSQ